MVIMPLFVPFSLKVQLSLQDHLGEDCAALARKAIILTLNKARDFHLDQIFILTSSLKVVCEIKGKEDWILRSYVADILNLTKSFASIKFYHFSRVSNAALHSLAKFCSKFVVDYEFFDNFSDWLAR